MSDDAQPTIPDNDPPLSSGSASAADFWADNSRAYDAEYRHHTRMSRLHQRNVSFAAQQFQAQMLGLMLLGESEMPLEEVPSEPEEPAQPDPTVQP